MQPVFIIEGVDVTLILLLVLVRVSSKQFLKEEAISFLYTLPPKPILLFLGLDLQAVLGDDFNTL